MPADRRAARSFEPTIPTHSYLADFDGGLFVNLEHRSNISAAYVFHGRLCPAPLAHADQQP